MSSRSGRKLVEREREWLTYMLLSAVGEATLPPVRITSAYLWFIASNGKLSIHLNDLESLWCGSTSELCKVTLYHTVKRRVRQDSLYICCAVSYMLCITHVINAFEVPSPKIAAFRSEYLCSSPCGLLRSHTTAPREFTQEWASLWIWESFSRDSCVTVRGE